MDFVKWAKKSFYIHGVRIVKVLSHEAAIEAA